MFPEATRNTSKDLLGPYKLGAFRLSLKTKTPIAMMTFLNSGDRMAPGNWLLSPGNFIVSGIILTGLKMGIAKKILKH